MATSSSFPLSAIAQLSRYFASLLGFFCSSETFKRESLVVVGNSEVGARPDSTIVGGQGLLVALEVVENGTLVVVGIGVVGVKLESVLVASL